MVGVREAFAFANLEPFAGWLDAGDLEVVVHHDLNKLKERHPGAPVERRLRLRYVRSEEIDFCRAEITWVDFYDDIARPQGLSVLGRQGAGRFNDSLLVYTRACPFKLYARVGEGLAYEFPDRVTLPSPHDIVVGKFLLEHDPHHLNVLGCEPPVPLRVQVAEVELFLIPFKDIRDSPRGFPGDERLPPARRFMVEEYAVASEETVPFPVIHRHPIGVELGRSVGAPRIEGRLLALGGRGCTEELRGRGLVVLRGDAAPSYGFEKLRGAEAGRIARVFGHVEADPHMALSCQVVDLVGLYVIDHVGELARIGEVSEVQEEPCTRLMRVGVDVVDAARVERACPSDQTVDLVALCEKEFRKV